MDSKRTRLTVLLTSEQGQRLEDYCETEGYKKSTLVARLIRDFLREKAAEPKGDARGAE